MAFATTEVGDLLSTFLDGTGRDVPQIIADSGAGSKTKQRHWLVLKSRESSPPTGAISHNLTGDDDKVQDWDTKESDGSISHLYHLIDIDTANLKHFQRSD